MELDSETKASVLEQVGPIIGGLGAAFAVAAGAALITKLVGVNIKKQTMAGDTGMHPTENETSISKTETSAKDNEASLAKDGLKAKDGDLSAAQTDAKAMTTDAKALDSGASAAQPKAGALDVKTKGLVMS
ncbi:MAG: hypothetical protein LBK63_10805 [Treponema sp.]|jgi:hypothetical protein|nr:hypothetical protein [Treponema sp.]